MHLFSFRFKRGKEGQGLVEYALILVFVAIVTIAIVTLFGEAIAEAYCGIVYTLNPGATPTQTCNAPIVTCTVTNANASSFNLEAVVIDPDNPTPNTVQRVEFYIGPVDRTPNRTEYIYRYCFGGGDTTCNPAVVPSGSQINIVVYDADGNSDTCTTTAN